MDTSSCPICDREIKTKEIELHVNNCLFLNSRSDSESPKRKRDDDGTLTRIKIAKPSESTANNKIQNLPTENSENREESPKEYSFKIPLAETLRPTRLDDFVGQEHTVGSGTILKKLMETGDIPSLILWGPPGCGKTTLANIIKEFLLQKRKHKNEPPVRFVKLYATMAGVSDVKGVINCAKNELQMFQRRTVLFMDEIHRFNKSQQDTFLPYVENGTITLIGATTENPSFSLNNALLSRCRVITLNKLSSTDLLKILHRAVNSIGGSIINATSNNCYSAVKHKEKWCTDHETIQWLSDISDGDARIALNSLQMAVQSKVETDVSNRKADFTVPRITLTDIKDSIKRSHLLYDKKGEEHYNSISALHKSIRASDDSAALYWLTRMLEGGEDPIFVARRLVRTASEDIGLADSNALTLAVSTMQGCQLLGMPECDVLLAHLVVYLARSPKSVEVYHAVLDAQSTVRQHRGAIPSVPLHLRNAPTTLMKNLGYGKNYNTQHKSESGLTYMPEGLEHVTFFNKERK